MRTKTGVFGVCLMALGVLGTSSTNTKTAEAHVSAGKPLVAIPARSPTAVASSASANVNAIEKASTTVIVPAEVVTPPPADLNLEDPKLCRMQPREISKSMLEAAAQIVRKHHAKPVGTLITVEVDGKPLVARIERHFHPEGGPVKPWGFHPGVSLFVPR